MPPLRLLRQRAGAIPCRARHPVARGAFARLWCASAAPAASEVKPEEMAMRLRTWHVAGALLLAAPSATAAQATQPWPERTIQAIVPFAPGAANDIVGRI